MAHHPKTALALLSSGLDSSVAVLLAQREFTIELALTFDYGQRAAQKEIRHAKEIARAFGIKHRSLSLPWFQEFESNALIGKKTLPRPTQLELTDLSFTSESARAVWIPNRNGVFIECAAAFADGLGIQHVVVGFNKEEGTTFPDNTAEYLAAINTALSYSTQNKVSVISPTISWTKKDIVFKAKEAGFPFETLWSCYEGKESMCGTCESCMRLKRGLFENGVPFDKLFKNTVL